MIGSFLHILLCSFLLHCISGQYFNVSQNISSQINVNGTYIPIVITYTLQRNNSAGTTSVAPILLYNVTTQQQHTNSSTKSNSRTMLTLPLIFFLYNYIRKIL
ncbi:unnamed protein product [Adineta ricciae]|uniref:Uncharacterized protein n=1 Tax=Adineta ricciae TaxID=249248 RepID=A0A813XIA0_ADIRI|nr:unnamed protein product [Adineta ricciae]